MQIAAFDTHDLVKRLTGVGMPEPQAEVLAGEHSLLIHERLASKRDLKELEASNKRDIKALEVRLKHNLETLETRLNNNLSELETRLKHSLETGGRDQKQLQNTGGGYQEMRSFDQGP